MRKSKRHMLKLSEPLPAPKETTIKLLQRLDELIAQAHRIDGEISETRRKIQFRSMAIQPKAPPAAPVPLKFDRQSQRQ